MKLIQGNVFVRMQPVQVVATKDYEQKKLDNEAFLREAELLFRLEQWLNSEVAAQAFEKFKVGLRVHIPAD